MSHSGRIKSGLGLLVLLSMLSVTAYADRDDRDRRDRDDRRSHPQTDMRLDQRYHHDRYYPRSGHVITTLPPRYHRVPYHNSYFYYNSGIWYRPDGPRFIVTVPPIGVVVPILPAFYTTIWISGIPYYYANDVYYVWRPDLNGYMVTAPPGQINEQEPPLVADELFVYPAKGQTEQQQADDRFECHRWSVEKTGYDPTQPASNAGTGALNVKREDYQRAMKACLEGRGYTVR